MHPSFTSTSLPLASSHHSSDDAAVDECAQIFNCNICMHLSHDPVVTSCGHLFCWPCLYCHLFLLSASKECPVCRADVQDRNIVPLYGCGIEIGYSTDSAAAEKFRGIHIPCRPSAARSVAPANVRGRREPSRAGRFNEMHTHRFAHPGFYASILRFVVASLPPENSGFLRRHAHSAVSLLVNRRRFNNEKEFVLHWVCILMALVAIAIFLAC